MSIPGLRVAERHEAEIRLTLAFAVTGTCVGFVLAFYLAYLFPGIPLSVLLLEWAGAILLAAGVPFIARAIRRGSLPFATPRGRRQGVVCRRKDTRAGGRRQTDVVLLLPTGSSPMI